MDYPNSGLLLTNTRKTADNQPDMTGDIKMERDYLLDLIDRAEDEVIVIKLGAWLKKDRNGTIPPIAIIKNLPMPQRS